MLKTQSCTIPELHIASRGPLATHDLRHGCPVRNGASHHTQKLRHIVRTKPPAVPSVRPCMCLTAGLQSTWALNRAGLRLPRMPNVLQGLQFWVRSTRDIKAKRLCLRDHQKSQCVLLCCRGPNPRHPRHESSSGSKARSANCKLAPRVSEGQ